MRDEMFRRSAAEMGHSKNTRTATRHSLANPDINT
jgi:hypothetical protein